MEILFDVEVALSALFRYCMATSIVNQARTQNKEIFNEIALRYRQAAVMQYIPAADVYDTTWGKFIPPAFHIDAEQLYSHAIGRTAFERSC